MVVEHLRKILGGAKKVEPQNVIEVEMKPQQEEGNLKLHMAVLEKFADTETVLTLMRSGDKIVLVKIRPLREKDMTELKRSINRLKTHCAATGGDLAAIDDNWIVVVPQSVGIERGVE